MSGTFLNCPHSDVVQIRQSNWATGTMCTRGSTIPSGVRGAVPGTSFRSVLPPPGATGTHRQTLHQGFASLSSSDCARRHLLHRQRTSPARQRAKHTTDSRCTTTTNKPLTSRPSPIPPTHCSLWERRRITAAATYHSGGANSHNHRNRRNCCRSHTYRLYCGCWRACRRCKRYVP